MSDTDGERPGLEQVGAYMRQWREMHPRATLTDIEDELDRQLRRIRAEVVTETATSGPAELGVCSTCGARLTRRGERTRTLITAGDATITLQRAYASCPTCKSGLFPPLDEQLALLPGQHLTPALVEGIVRLGVLVPFAQVPPLIAHFTGVTVSVDTVRRLTEAAGAVQDGRESAAVEWIERTLPEPPPGPALQLLSVDGAMVPLVGGIWSEVKTLAIGTVALASTTAELVTTGNLSYFSRLTDAASFNRLATVETQRRGTDRDRTVVAVVDGAAWCQGFIDHQRHDAVRILDFAHALSHLSAVAQERFGPGTLEASEWLGQQAHALRHGREEAVLTHLAHLAQTGTTEMQAVPAATHGYLSGRLDQIRYQAFAAAGYPIGSGCVESANKLVVEARLKGSGMHWSRAQVTPMLALRTVVANQRWEETWPDVWTAWRQQARTRASEQRQRRSAAVRPVAAPVDPPAPTEPVDEPPPVPRPKTVVNGKPTATHIWRTTSPFRAKR